MTKEQEIIEEFRKDYAVVFGEEISFDEAQERLMRLVKFLKVVIPSNTTISEIINKIERIT